jgi:hypothetical protein
MSLISVSSLAPLLRMAARTLTVSGGWLSACRHTGNKQEQSVVALVLGWGFGLLLLRQPHSQFITHSTFTSGFTNRTRNQILFTNSYCQVYTLTTSSNSMCQPAIPTNLHP